MFYKLSRLIQRVSTGRNLAILSAFFIAVNLYLLLSPASPITIMRAYSGSGLLDMEFNYSPARAYELLTAYGELGREYYASVFALVDLLTPLLMNFFLAVVISITLRLAYSANSRWQMLNLLPLGALAADYLENLGIVLLIQSYPQRLEALARAAAFSTDLKFLFTFASLGCILVSLVVWRVRKSRD